MNDADLFQFFTDKRGKYRWRLVSENGEIIGASSQGYATGRLAKENAGRFGYGGVSQNVGIDDDCLDDDEESPQSEGWPKRGRCPECSSILSVRLKNA